MLQSDSDSNLYYSPTTRLLILLYVDDILLTAPSSRIVEEMKNKLKSHYRMSDLGPAKRYLGIDIVRHEDYIALHQQSFIQDLLKKNKMEHCKGVSTPLDKNTCLHRPRQSDSFGNHSSSNIANLPLSTADYQSLVGSLQWLMMATRPDLAYTTSTLGQFNSQPTTESIQAAKRVLRYLQFTSDFALHFPSKQSYLQNQDSKLSQASQSAELIPDQPIGYTDSDWAGDKVDRKSTYNYMFTLFATAVSWKSQKSSTVALSTTEAEYIGACEASKEAIWITRLVNDVSPNQARRQTAPNPCLIYGDNQGAIALVENPRSHQRTKHIDIRYHFIRQAYQKNLIHLQYIPTAQMTADIFTKALPQEPHYRHMLGMGLRKC